MLLWGPQDVRGPHANFTVAPEEHFPLFSADAAAAAAAAAVQRV